MTDVPEKPVSPVGDTAGELAAALAEIERLRGVNRELHRRAQLVEAPAQSYADQLKYCRELALRGWDSRMLDFRRMCDAHQEIQRIFLEVARVFPYPQGGAHRHSVMDSRWGEGSIATPGEIYANCYLSPQGGIQSYRVLDEVRRAIDELISLRKFPSPAVLPAEEGSPTNSA